MGVRFVALDLVGREDVEGFWLRNRGEGGRDWGNVLWTSFY